VAPGRGGALQPSHQRRMRKRERTVAAIRESLLRWSLFSVIFAVLPVAFNALSAATRGEVAGYETLVGRGELLLVSVGISAAAAGELFGQDERLLKSTRLFLVGMSFITVCIASLWFADIANLVRTNEYHNQHIVALGSTVVFFCAIVTGACCMVLREMKQ
jgi:hypothetical protein